MLDMALDGMEGKPIAAEWAAIDKCSADMARRYINDLLARRMLGRLEGRGAEYGVFVAQIG